MNKHIASQFERIDKLVEASGVADLDKQQTTDSLRKMPALCKAFTVSYESRDVDKILLLERNLLARLTDPTRLDSEGQELAKALTAQFNKLHERLGLPLLTPAKARVAASRR